MLSDQLYIHHTESNNVMAVSREGNEGLAGKEMKRLSSYRLTQRKMLDIEYKPS